MVNDRLDVRNPGLSEVAPDASQEDLAQEVWRLSLFAREQVYDLYPATPLDELDYQGSTFFLKREDLSSVHSFKWRGAFFAMSELSHVHRKAGVVAASAGNHAQGVAAAARMLGIRATIFLPTTAPQVKRRAVETLGGEFVTVRAEGASYDEAYAAARAFSVASRATFLHPFDDVHVMAGNATIGHEIVRRLKGQAAPEVAYLQVGGGGLAAGVATVLRRAYPKIRLVVVEAVGQASFEAAWNAGQPVELAEVSRFCDGTAVRRVGEKTFAVARGLIDQVLVVEPAAVQDAMRWLWEHRRAIPEPSGALGLAAALQETQSGTSRSLCIVSGANMDFAQLTTWADLAGPLS